MDDRGGHQTMRARQWPKTCGRVTLAWGLAALLLGLAPSATGQPAVAALLKTLALSDYPVGVMWPPPFKGQTATGQAVSLADLQGRVVLMNFWASWCAECRPEMPMFERLHQEFAAQGLAVVGINFREETEIVQRYAKTLGLTFPLILDLQGEIFQVYGVIGLPTTFLVGRDGRPVALAVGARAWERPEARALIQALLAESAAQKDGQ
jgi:thiol-disulfide isomerase/thioredoxin